MTTNYANATTARLIEGCMSYDRTAILASQHRAAIAKRINADKLNNVLNNVEVALMAAGWNGLAHYLTVDTTAKAPNAPKATTPKATSAPKSDTVSTRVYVTAHNAEGHRIHRRMAVPTGVNVLALAQERYPLYTITAITAR